MKILVTGKNGQVARSLFDEAAHHPDLSLVFSARDGGDVLLDLADPETIVTAIQTIQPDVIVNAAAYTAVDQAEDEPDLAHALNGEAPRHIARQARQIGARMIQISTDYVFDGCLDRPYQETDPVNPLGVYGQTKLAGERAVEASGAHYVILRTAWVYSPYGKNFRKTMLRLAEDRDDISVVDDQIGTPTSAGLIAQGILAICRLWRAGNVEPKNELYHLAGPDEMTWCGFARAIFQESAAQNGPTASVKAITSADFPTRAKRPRNSRLDSSRFHWGILSRVS